MPWSQLHSFLNPPHVKQATAQFGWWPAILLPANKKPSDFFRKSEGFAVFSLVLGLHGGDHEMRKLITLYNSTKPCISLSLKTFTPHKSTQLYIGCVSIGLSRGLNGVSTNLRGFWGVRFTLRQTDGRFPLFYGAARLLCPLKKSSRLANSAFFSSLVTSA